MELKHVRAKHYHITVQLLLGQNSQVQKSFIDPGKEKVMTIKQPFHARGLRALDTSRQGVTAVTFDLWETLLFEKDGASSLRSRCRCENLTQAFREFGMDVPVERVASALDKTISSLLPVWDANKDVSHLEQIHLLLRYATDGSTVSDNDVIGKLSSAYISPVFEIRPYLNPDAVGVLRCLKDQGKFLGLICNTGLTPGFGLRRLLAENGVVEYFDMMIFSDEVGIRKPDPRIFHLFTDRFKVRRTEVVHVGDNLKSDVLGAMNAGLKAIWFVGKEGKDETAESDPRSLISLSRNLGTLGEDQTNSHWEIASLGELTKIVEGLERASR